MKKRGKRGPIRAPRKRKIDRNAVDITMTLHDAMWANESYEVPRLKRGATQFSVADNDDIYTISVKRVRGGSVTLF